MKDFMVKKVEHLTYTDPYPNVTMDPEFHLVEEIYAIHQLYKIAALLKHAKGQQDRSKPLNALPFPAQLNVEADHWLPLFIARGLSQHTSRLI